MKYKLIETLESFIRETSQLTYKETKKWMIFFNSNNIPELDKIKVDYERIDEYHKRAIISKTGIPLKSMSTQEQFEFSLLHKSYEIVNGAKIRSRNPKNCFKVSYDRETLELQFAIEKDVINARYDAPCFHVWIYTDVLDDQGELLDDIYHFDPDIEISAKVMQTSKLNDSEQVFVLEHDDEEKEVRFSSDISIFNMIRAISTSIRDEYRKTTCLDEVKKIIKK